MTAWLTLRHYRVIIIAWVLVDSRRLRLLRMLQSRLDDVDGGDLETFDFFTLPSETSIPISFIKTFFFVCAGPANSSLTAYLAFSPFIKS